MGELYDKLKEYSNSGAYPFHMPGHKRQYGPEFYQYDITEIDGFDNLTSPEEGEILYRMIEHATALYGTEKTFPLVNGSTSGLMAAISACCNLQEEIIIARNCHKSVYRAAELLGLSVHYLYPDYIKEYGIFAHIEPENIKRLLEQYPKSKCVVLTSPTYEGVVVDVPAIAKVVHDAGKILVVDGAHGAHLSFCGIHAFEGADLVVESLHKTLPSLTQTAVLHIMKDACERTQLTVEKVENWVHLYQSTSPSYLLMSSMDDCFCVCKEWLENNRFKDYYEQMNKERSRYKKELKHIHLLEPEEIGIRDIKNTAFGESDMEQLEKNEKQMISYENYDLGKLVFITAGTSITGPELMSCLREEYQIELEMASANYAIAMTSVCDSEEGFRRLYDAIIAIDNRIETVCEITPTIPVHKKPKKKKVKLRLALVTDDGGDESVNIQSECSESQNDSYHPNVVFTLRDAKSKPSVSMSLDNIHTQLVDGYISTSTLPLQEMYHQLVSADYVMCYPPGIPIVTPGEEITVEILAQIEEAIKQNLPLLGVSDGKIAVVV